AVALQTWLRVLNLELNRDRKLSKKSVALIEGNLHAHVFLEELRGVAELFFRQLDLLVVGVIHDNVAGAVVVQVRHIATVNRSGFNLGACTPSLIGYLAGNNIFELAAHKSWALARLNVLKLNNLLKLVINF